MSDSLERELAARESAEPFPVTDLGNSERLVAMHAPDIRYAPGIGWLAWDDRRFRPDDTGELLRRAKQTARAIYHDAANCDSADERKRIVTWARQSESEPRLRAMVNLAASDKAIVVRPAQLDADPYLLNVLNGTIGLRTGELREHRREDLITKLAPVAYDPNARSKRWEAFLQRVTGRDQELAGFLQRLAGYTITGATDEEILAFPHGPGATGKTTMVEALKAALGDYACTADFETFLARRGDAGIRNDVARLAGTRMVVSVEVEDGKRLAEGLIKQLTGGDKVTARFLHQEHFEFVPQFKLWLVANTRPPAHASDDALWRRILQVPFVEVIPAEERDPSLKRALRTEPAEQTAILAWLVQGCLHWQRQGLNVPDRVRDYTEQYRQENDPLADWIADACQLGDEHWTASKDLKESYERWCHENDITPVRSLPTELGNKPNLQNGRGGKGVRGWRGIGLRPGVTGSRRVTPDSTNSLHARYMCRFTESDVTHRHRVTHTGASISLADPVALADRMARRPGGATR